MYIVGGYFEEMADIYTLVAFVELGLGFLYVLNPPTANDNNAAAVGEVNEDGSPAVGGSGSKTNSNSRRRASFKILRIATAGIAVVLFALATALLGEVVSAYAAYYKALSASDAYEVAFIKYMKKILISRQLGAAFDIILWVLSMPLIGFAGFVVHSARGTPIKNTAVLYLVATILWFIRYLWHLIYNAVWLLPTSSDGAPIWFNVADPLLNVWTFFVLLVLLYVVCVRRQQGLWSTPQPWMQVVAPIGPVAYSYGPGGYNNGAYPPPSAPSSASPQQLLQHQPSYQLPNHEQQQYQPHQLHEMPQAPPYQQQQVPSHPQEMYAPQQQHQQHVAAYQPTPPPPSGYSGTPPSELKS